MSARSMAALCLCLALPACASTGDGWDDTDFGGEDDFARPGTYVGVSAVKGMEQFRNLGPLDASNSDVGVGLRVGQRIDPRFAVEVAVDQVPGYELSAPGASADLDVTSVAVQGKYFFTEDRVQPYALFGLGWTEMDVDAAGLDNSEAFVRAGAGVDVYLSRNVALFGEATWNVPAGDLDDAEHIDFQMGLLFRF